RPPSSSSSRSKRSGRFRRCRSDARALLGAGLLTDHPSPHGRRCREAADEGRSPRRCRPHPAFGHPLPVGEGYDRPPGPTSNRRRGRETTAVNIFEGRRNLLWVKDLKQLITYCKSNISSMKIIGYIVNANLIVILGDMDKDRATPDRPDNPLSKCRHASNDLHGSGLGSPPGRGPGRLAGG